ncbi:VOC family protein [Streptomyces nodosus]|uniref:VOC family protein n=1 Tax=Streptomyces nodosus TaxID=40318 RepID=UPI000694C965|nr:VOC family protein [Streptomyces nodosus]MBB4794360.1 putative enzyme related to lactoylglutathione lyase [Streptomyces nodosus]
MDIAVPVHEDGTPAWVELTTPDAETSTRFYGELFGWSFDGAFGGQPQSQLAVDRGRPSAVVTTVPGAERGGWTVYVNVADADKALEKVVAAGGSVSAELRTLGSAGRSAVLADHAGTRFGIWEADGHHGSGVVGEPGAFHGGELITDDVEASAAFYAQVFSWNLGKPYGPLGRRDWRLGGRTVSVLLPRPPAMSAEIPPYWDVYFTVGDAERAVEAAVRLGATVLMPSTGIEHGTIAVLSDPTGAVFTVVAASH